MSKYQIKVLDSMFGELNGVFIAESKELVVEEAKEFYAYELGTEIDEIEVLDVIVCK